MAGLGGQTDNFSDIVNASQDVSGAVVISRTQETPAGKAVTLTANGQVIPTETPVVVLSSAGPGAKTGLVLSPPPIPSKVARVVLLNTTGALHQFNIDPLTSNVADSDLLKEMQRNSAFQFVWEPVNQLWYQTTRD